MIRYDEHAEFQIARRGIEKQWVEDALRDPDETSITGNRMSHYKCLPMRTIMLRVVTPIDDTEYVITAYFDRRMPCA